MAIDTERLCAHCIPFRLPDVPEELRPSVAAAVRADGTFIGGMIWLKDRGYPLLDAKVVALHVTREPGRCQRCSRPLAGGPGVVCSGCKALNLDW